MAKSTGLVGKTFNSEMKRKKTIILIILFSTSLSPLILAHLAGHKIYGSPTLYDNQPLDKPRKVAKINQAGEIVLADGNQYRIYGIKTILSDPLRQIKYFQQQLPTFQVDIINPDKRVSKIWYKSGNLVWCGNVFFPRFFPGKLGRFRKEDLGTRLVWMGGAIPTIEVFKGDPNYAKNLTLTMRDAAPKLKFEKDKEYASKLGRFLINERPEFFNTGAWLLTHTGDSEILNIVRKRIVDNLVKRELEGHVTISRNEGEDLIPILIKLSREVAKGIVRKIFGEYKNKFPNLKVAFALKTLTIDDWYGLDTLMGEIIDTTLDTSYRQGMVSRLENPLILCWQRGGGDYKESYEDYWARMAQWYRDNKDRLIWNDERQQMTFKKDDKSDQ